MNKTAVIAKLGLFKVIMTLPFHTGDFHKLPRLVHCYECMIRDLLFS